MGRSESSGGVARRDVIIGGGLLAAGLAAERAAGGEHSGSHATQHKYFDAKRYKKHAGLVAVTNACITRGDACLSHCMETFLAGDTTMAECAFAVQQMLEVCRAMSALAAADSKHLGAMAGTCVAVCEDCERECRVHEDHQPECKACADACAALVAKAKPLAA